MSGYQNKRPGFVKDWKWYGKLLYEENANGDDTKDNAYKKMNFKKRYSNHLKEIRASKKPVACTDLVNETNTQTRSPFFERSNMKAIKDCKWEVEMCNIYVEGWCWYASASANTGLENLLESIDYFETERRAINNFKRFAKLNGIENYSIKE